MGDNYMNSVSESLKEMINHVNRGNMSYRGRGREAFGGLQQCYAALEKVSNVMNSDNIIDVLNIIERNHNIVN